MMEWEKCECSNMRKQRYKLTCTKPSYTNVMIVIQLCTSNEIQKTDLTRHRSNRDRSKLDGSGNKRKIQILETERKKKR